MNKPNSIIYCCFICNFVEHKIDDYLHKDATQAMLREKAMVATPKKDDVTIIIILQLPFVIRYPKMWYSRKKTLSKTKPWLIGKTRKSFNVHLKKLLRTCNKRSCLELIYKLGLKPTSPRIPV